MSEYYKAIEAVFARIKAEVIGEILATDTKKKDIASHYAPGAEVVTVEVLEHYARQFAEGSGE
jgi:hypothetical protein